MNHLARLLGGVKLQLKWAFGFAGDVTAFAAPTIVNGTLFVGSAGGTVQALDAETGCLHWVYDANAPVRSAMAVIGTGAQTRLVFSDQIGGVHALDARTGKRLWKARPEAHEATRLTATPAVHNGVVFVAAASWEETRSIRTTHAVLSAAASPRCARPTAPLSGRRTSSIGRQRRARRRSERQAEA